MSPREPQTIDEVLARFERSYPPEGDDKRHFHAVYHRNTIAVKHDLDLGLFEDPVWFEPWDAIFANLYLDALDTWNSGGEPSGPWQVAFRAAEGPRMSPLVNVLVGLNAHLNFDLPLALLAVVADEELLDRELMRSRHEDFAHIDQIVTRRVKEEDLELRRYEQPGDRTLLDRAMTPFNRAASKRFLQEARYKVWRNAMELSVARRSGPEAYAARLVELEKLCRAKVEDLVRPGKVLIRLGLTGFGVLLGPPTVEGLANPEGWPAEVLPAFDRYLVAAFATVSGAGHPVTYPLTPYVGEDGRTLDVSCGLTSPSKAERARRQPRVCLLYSDATGSDVPEPPTVLVYGRASVRDRSLQYNTDRYIRRSLAKLPWPWRGVPRALMRGLDWYWSRIWIRVTPERILWWRGSDLSTEPTSWEAPGEMSFPASDPPPSGAAPPAWRRPHAEPAARADADGFESPPVLTVLDPGGYPVPIPSKSCNREGDSYRVQIPAGAPVEPKGPACLTFMRHNSDFSDYENRVFVGEAEPAGNDEALFTPARVLPDVSLTGSRARRIFDFASNQRKLKGRVVAEAARRGQSPPEIRIPRYR